MWTSDRRRGSALLAVLWLSAALAAIGFALSTTVRSETDRAATAADGLRSYYLAAGAVERAALELLWSVQRPDQRPIPQGATAVEYDFPSGAARVEILPEAGKLDINSALPIELYRLGMALGLQADRAQEIAAAIEDWRRPGANTEFDQYYLSLTPSFRSPHASFQEIEELLAVKGITPEIYYGTYVPASESGGLRLVPRGGLADCLSVFGSRGAVDANTASPAVLSALGLEPYAVAALVERRRMAPIAANELSAFLQSIGAPASRLRVGGNSIATVRATARLRLSNGQLSDLRRTVAAQVKYMPPEGGYDSLIHILRWYDTAWSN